ncbi:TonB-dependent receptor [Sulfurimonas sp. NWX367]|uniref:TonB-dependent receptor n=1 Tax=Sulfurimonas sp. NWX367 TaxID=2925413 RepID=UPI003204F934
MGDNGVKRSIRLFLLVCLAVLQLQAEDLLSSIMTDMKQFNEIATQTKQNEHYQPYIISVFEAKELEKLGVSTLKEALLLVPGVDMATDNFNNQTPIFRGSNPFAYGQSKLLIDGVLVNNLFFDSYSEYLSMPIEMIKRIEVIRGPGSKVDGINAYAGSINVVTYAEDFEEFESNDKVVFKYGSYDYTMGGFVKNFKSKEFKTHIDFYYQKDNKNISSGPDGLSQGALGPANIALSQSGEAPLWLDEYSLGLDVRYKDFRLKARMLQHKQGSAYGINLALPQKSDRMKLPSYYAELGYMKKIHSFKLDIKAGVKYNAFDSKAKLAPDNLVLGSVVFPDGIYGEHYAKQRVLYQSTYVKYSGVAKHTITIGYKARQERTIQMSSKLSNLATGDATLVDYTLTRPFFDKDASRDVYTFFLGDEYNVNAKLSILYGINYEQTSYEDAGFEPRISFVYHKDFKNIFKAIYSNSHRNPSWQEMFTKNNSARVGSTDLKPEKVTSYELAYIRNFSNDAYLQANLFYLANKDQIYNSVTDPVYKNSAKTDIYGIELEFRGHILPNDKVYANYTYTDGSYRMDGSSDSNNLPNVSHHLVKGFYIYNINPALALSATAKYVSSKERVETDLRPKLKGYMTLDTAVNYKNIQYGYTLNVSVKNLFDTDVRYPSSPNTYVNDYAQERRTFLLTFKKRF